MALVIEPRLEHEDTPQAIVAVLAPRKVSPPEATHQVRVQKPLSVESARVEQIFGPRLH